MTKPWLDAEPESIWEISGSTPGGDTFTACLAMVAPFTMTAGVRLFILIGPALHGSPPIAPDRIAHARRLVLVHADEPRTAYFEDEQDLADREAQR